MRRGMMTHNEIANLRKLLANATPGPWRQRNPSDGCGADKSIIQDGGKNGVIGNYFDFSKKQCQRDIALIVAAVNVLPGLLDEVETLRTIAQDAVSENERANSLCERIVDLEAALKQARSYLRDDGLHGPSRTLAVEVIDTVLHKEAVV